MTKPIFPHEMQTVVGMDDLIDLALDLRWSWDHQADDIWRPLAPELWDLTRNPWDESPKPLRRASYRNWPMMSLSELELRH